MQLLGAVRTRRVSKARRLELSFCKTTNGTRMANYEQHGHHPGLFEDHLHPLPVMMTTIQASRPISPHPKTTTMPLSTNNLPPFPRQIARQDQATQTIETPRSPSGLRSPINLPRQLPCRDQGTQTREPQMPAISATPRSPRPRHPQKKSTSFYGVPST